MVGRVRPASFVTPIAPDLHSSQLETRSDSWDKDEMGIRLESNAHEHGVHQKSTAPIWLQTLLGAALVAAVVWIGSPRLEAPWLQGDERIFIANNPDVTGSNGIPLLRRLSSLFSNLQEDLYQPVPVATYAIEWSLWGDRRIERMRLTDVLLHAMNAILVWCVLHRLCRAIGRESEPPLILTWSLALLWALHPCLTAAFSADMGRTHLLAAFFLLTSLLMHLRFLQTGNAGWFVSSLPLIVLSMMSKPTAGWFLVLAAIEAASIGWRKALRSFRIYSVAVICAFFALLSLFATREAGMLTDSKTWVFGDFVSRSLLGVTIYVSHIIWPVNLATWYPPEIGANWRNPAVWIGAALAIGGILIAYRCISKPHFFNVAAGVIWFWAMMLPLLGIVGAREIAAQDRYLYLPLVGILLSVAAAVLAAMRTQRQTALAAALFAACAISMMPLARALASDTRDMIRRAERILARDPEDPRRMENLAIAYGYISDRPEMQAHYPGVDFLSAFPARIRAAGQAGIDAPRYFRNERDRAAFHRRISWKLLENRDADGAFQHAQLAAQFEPEAPMTLLTLARAYQAKADWRAEFEIFAKLEKNLPDDPGFKAIALTEFGDLLLTVLDRPDLAKERLRRAVQTQAAGTPAKLKLARCEILAGHGETGFQMAAAILAREPENVAAAEVIALFHARSHHWDDALNAYAVILEREPTNYEALRGFHEVCMQTGRMHDAMIAWQDAVRLGGDSSPIYRSYFVWAAACGNDPKTVEWADEILAERTDRFALLAKMLIAVRRDEIESALNWVEAAQSAQALPSANELLRAEAALRLMSEKSELPQDAALVRAKILLATGNRQLANEVIDRFLKMNEHSRIRSIAERMRNAAETLHSVDQP